MAEALFICEEAELTEGNSRLVMVGSKAVAVYNVRGAFYAMEDTCPHMGASLSAGPEEDGIVTCPWHFWRFRLCDGAWADNPRLKIATYPVEVRDGRIFLQTEKSEETNRCGE